MKLEIATYETHDQRDVMSAERFDELLESVKEAGAYLRGERGPGKVTFLREPDPRAIRERLGLTQQEFADRLGVSVRTLQNWEQGRRRPSGPAMRLLQIEEKRLLQMAELSRIIEPLTLDADLERVSVSQLRK